MTDATTPTTATPDSHADDQRRPTATNPAPKKRPGRPRLHDSAAARNAASRSRRRQGGERRWDLTLSDTATWQLKELAGAWGVIPAEVVERLLREAGQPGGAYRGILYPDTD
jgi:hypothetical protein